MKTQITELFQNAKISTSKHNGIESKPVLNWFNTGLSKFLKVNQKFAKIGK